MKNKINKKEVGERIRKIRFSKCLTLEQFGNLFHAVKSNVQSWENGSCLPNKKRQLAIAKLGKISVNELLYGNIEKDIETIKVALSNLPTKERVELILGVLKETKIEEENEEKKQKKKAAIETITAL